MTSGSCLNMSKMGYISQYVTHHIEGFYYCIKLSKKIGDSVLARKKLQIPYFSKSSSGTWIWLNSLKLNVDGHFKN